MGQHNSNCKELRGRFRCPYCNKGYMMEWAKNNHVKVCPWKNEGEEDDN